MPMYCCRDDVRDKLQDQFPSFIHKEHPDATEDQKRAIWFDIIDTWISNISSDIDAAVGDNYRPIYNNNTQKFPDRSDSPGTPGSIVMAASLYLKSMIVGSIPGMVTEYKDPEKDLRAAAEKIITDIREGRRVVFDTVAVSTRKYDRSRGNVFTKDAFRSW